MAVRFITLFFPAAALRTAAGRGRRHRPAPIPPGLFADVLPSFLFQQIPDLRQQLFLIGRLRWGGFFGRGFLLLFQLVMEAVDGLDHQEHRKGDDEKIQNRGQEAAIFDGNLRSGIDPPVGSGNSGLQHDLPIGKINAAGEHGDQRHDDIIHKGKWRSYRTHRR